MQFHSFDTSYNNYKFLWSISLASSIYCPCYVFLNANVIFCSYLTLNKIIFYIFLCILLTVSKCNLCSFCLICSAFPLDKGLSKVWLIGAAGFQRSALGGCCGHTTASTQPCNPQRIRCTKLALEERIEEIGERDLNSFLAEFHRRMSQSWSSLNEKHVPNNKLTMTNATIIRDIQVATMHLDKCNYIGNTS